MTTLHIIVEIAEQVPTGRTEWRVDCAECGWYDMFDDRRRAEDAATRHVGTPTRWSGVTIGSCRRSASNRIPRKATSWTFPPSDGTQFRTPWVSYSLSDRIRWRT